MIEYLSVDQVLYLHRIQIRRFGGSPGLRDPGALEAAVARPQMTFAGEDLYPELETKAAALMHSLVQNHSFVDGNKRVGAMALELFLRVNGFALRSSATELIELTLGTARGELAAEAIAIWIRQRLVKT